MVNLFKDFSIVFTSLGSLFKLGVFAGFLLTLATTVNFWIANFFVKLGFIDKPDAQLKTHKVAVPYSGGTATFLLFGILSWFLGLNGYLFLILSLFFLLGLLDDIFSIPQWQKFLIQAGILLTANLYVFPRSLFWWEFLWMLSVINAFNLIDVADGLCASVALFSAINFRVIAAALGNSDQGFIFLGMAVIIAGFLRFNFPPARYYLGDTGSTFLGAFFAIYPWFLPWPGLSVKLLSCATILALPLAEVTMLVLIRSSLGLAPFRGSPHHFVHFLRAKNWSDRKILGLISLMGILLGLLAVGLVIQAIKMLLLLSILLVAFCLWLLVVYL